MPTNATYAARNPVIQRDVRSIANKACSQRTITAVNSDARRGKRIARRAPGCVVLATAQPVS